MSSGSTGRTPHASPGIEPASHTRGSSAPQATGGGGGLGPPLSGASRPSPREVRRLQRIEVGREQILDAAEELFGRNGYRGTSLQQVAKRCEFSIGALYLFIESKDKLLQGVLERRVAALANELHGCAAADGPAHEVLARLTRTLVAFHRRHPDFGRLSAMIISSAVEAAAPGFGEEATREYQEIIEIETEVFARGQADGTLRTGDPRSLARLFSAMVAAYHGLDPVVAPAATGHLADEDFFDCVARAFHPALRS